MKANQLSNNPLQIGNKSKAYNVIVSLDEVLSNRENRQHRQQQWVDQYGSSLISLTLVIPGAIKDKSVCRIIFSEALSQINKLILNHQYKILKKAEFYLPTGCEMLMAIDANPVSIKKSTVKLETDHPFGRLWDIDVISSSGQIISREHIGNTVRKCLICDNPARDCARSRNHNLLELWEAIEKILRVAQL